MDPRLAEIYGTNEEVSDVEKTAAAELAEKLASDEEVSIDDMSAEEIEALAADVLSDESETSETEEDDNSETASDENQEKLAEADYLGRVMAHAYVQELKGIDKEAAKPTAEEMGKGSKMNPDGVGKRLVRRASAAAHGAKKGLNRAKGAVASNKTIGKVTGHVAKHQSKYKALGVAGALAGAGGAGYMAGKRKHSSALDTLALERAKEILAENGVELEETEEKTASDTSKYDILAQTVEARAIELLQENGFEFETEETDAE